MTTKPLSFFSHPLVVGLAGFVIGISSVYLYVEFNQLSYLSRLHDISRISPVREPAPSAVVTSSYYTQDGNIYFHGKEVHTRYPDTFEPLVYDYARDEKYAYYDGRMIPDADGQTFEVIGYIMAQDKNRVYTFDRAEPAFSTSKPLRYIGNSYTEYNGYIYFKGSIMTIADVETFIPTAGDYLALDKNNFYYAGSVITEAEYNERYFPASM